MQKYLTLYQENSEFHAFVDKTCKCYGITVEEALTKYTVREVADYYEHKHDDDVPDTVKIDVGCGGGC